MKASKLVMAVALMGAAMGAAAEAIPFRGVVEGYYGRPWGTEGRLSLLKFMGENDMNVFIYGPKDDPYHHAKWRENYPAAEMKDFAKLLKVAKENRVNFYWAVHLGGGFRKNNADDYAALFKKLGSMYDAGFRAFAAFFDDFGGADASFHAEICNRIQRDFLDKKGDCAPLIMCPNVYWGGGHKYQKTLGAELDKRVNIMWTGRSICSDITEDAVRRITEDFQRPPFIWWNWPVNDYCRRKVLLGRTYGLANCKYAGFVSNPMENCEANKLALYGVAKWAKDPEHFDSQATWEESFAKIYPDPEIAKAMRVFAEHNADQGPNGHGYRREESVSAKALCERAGKEFDAEGKLTDATTKELRALFREVGKASETLLRKLPRDKGLGWEIEGWLDQESAQMGTGLMTLELMNAKDAKAQRTVAQKILRTRQRADASAEKHVAKFREATFPNDKGNVKKPEASTTVLKPLVEKMLEGTLRKMYAKKHGGVSFAATDGFKAFSKAAAIRNPQVALTQNKYAGYERIMEQREIKPDESFGLAVPASWKTDYFHAKLENADAAKCGVIELSKDGKTWTKLATRNHGGEMQERLNPKDGWRFARYRNTSGKATWVKVAQFKFDVKGVENAIDGLLRDAAK